jgi:predicted nuclease of predicted toxin-antitoxin system
MPKYLIDANLPYYFSVWNDSDFIHQLDIQNDQPDSEIWQYAKVNNMTIVTKDSDFSNRILLVEPPLRVIHIRIRNTSMKEFYSIISSSWEDIKTTSESHKLVVVFKNTIEALN